jgi:hypothetical protein
MEMDDSMSWMRLKRTWRMTSQESETRAMDDRIVLGVGYRKILEVRADLLTF